MSLNIVIIISYISHVFGQITYPYTCPATRDTNAMCTAVYIPVCGWFGKGVNCVAYPCAITIGNGCEACKNVNVEYVTDGACPPVNGLPTTTYPYQCQNSDRGRTNCPTDTDPVVWTNNKNCQGTNCNEVFTNVCVACSNIEVDIVKKSAEGSISKLYMIGLILLSLLIL